ncbi:uracil-DNA glycosylase [Sneathiella sp.]|uniref:uracil-DNA glycosylase n=1 Tax=Sneathiella sp. TaxID=1964365 RepID=UPI002FE12BDA
MDIDRESLLRFYLEAGVDEAIGDTPVNRLAPPAAPEATNARAGETRHKPVAPSPLRAPRRAPADAARPLHIPPLLDAVEAARKAASACTTPEELRAALEAFDYCALKKSAHHTVFAKGDPAAPVMIIDRQPSDAEDRSGMPFAGAAGELLENMLAAINLAPTDAYLASAIPWRPPGMRELTHEEKALCLPFIQRHIEIVKPRHILACGEAAGYLLGVRTGINKLRGEWKDLQIGEVQARILPVFHPAFLITQPALKKFAWADLLKLKAALEDE